MRLNEERGSEPTEVEEVCSGIARVPLLTDTLPPATRTNTYLVRGERGLWVVDLGTDAPEEIAVFTAALREYAIRWKRDLGGLILTHHHPDHVAGLRWWAETMPLPVIAHEKTVALVAEKLGPDGEEIASKIDWVTLEGDDEGDGLRFVDTPGHAPGHLAIFTGPGTHHNAANVLIAGDLVAGFGTIVVAPPRGNMSDYLASLEKAAALGPELLLPSHGPGTTAAVERLEAYHAHRLQREERVRAALTEAAETPAAITTIAYDDVPAALHFFAEWSVRAHLVRLVELGEAVATEDDRYRRA